MALAAKHASPNRGKEDLEVVSKHTTLVKRIAHHLVNKLPPTVQIDDLVQAGMIGLIEAARNFDSNRGASFTTYAGIRIRGAMLDEIRRGDWAPRSVHRNSRKIAQAVKDIENNKGRDPTGYEIAREMGVSIDEYYNMVKDSNGAKIFAIEDLGIGLDLLTTAVNEPNPLEDLQQDNFKHILYKEMKKLPEREQKVLALYYNEDLNLREVGELLGVSESRISQIHSAAMVRLQSRLSSWNKP